MRLKGDSGKMQQFKSQDEVDQFVNEMRGGRGLDSLPVGYHVTEIHEGMRRDCGCEVVSVRPGSHYTIYRCDECVAIYSLLRRREVVRCVDNQAVFALNEHTKAVMRIDLPWPHELPGFGNVRAQFTTT